MLLRKYTGILSTWKTLRRIWVQFTIGPVARNGTSSKTGSKCLCIVMATAEQMQEAFQQQQHELQVLTARMAAMETQLQFETARAHKAEHGRSRLIENMGSMRKDCGSAMVDTKEIGQPFTLKGTSDQDFGEWTHKERTFMLARFGVTALTWAARQQRIVVKTCVASQRNRMISWITVFGDQVGEGRLCWKLYAYLVSFTTNRIVRNSGEGNGFGSVETTAQRVRSDIIHETCGDPSASSEPSSMPTCRRIGICS